MVLGERLELSSLSAYAPKAYVSTISTNRAGSSGGVRSHKPVG